MSGGGYGLERQRNGNRERKCRKCNRWVSRSRFRKEKRCMFGVTWECAGCYAERRRGDRRKRKMKEHAYPLVKADLVKP